MSRTERMPDGLAAVDDDQVAEAAAHHRDGGLLERPVGRGERELGREVLGDPLGVGVLAAPSESRMSRSVTMPGPIASGSITTPRPRRARPSGRRLAERVPRPHGQDHRAHPVPHLHVLSPSELVECDDQHKPTDAGSRRRRQRQRASAGLRASLGRTRVRNPLPCPSQRPATVELRSSLYADANAIVEREYAADLSLDDIARRVASSRRQLQRAYAEIGNTTFREHLTARPDGPRRRAARARGGVTVREVAHRVGYRQPAQFAKAFRRHQGVAPSDYRARARYRALTRPRTAVPSVPALR